MSDDLRGGVLRQVAWITAVLVVLVVSMGGWTIRLGHRKARVDTAQAEIAAWHARRGAGPAPAVRSTSLEVAEATLHEWRSMAARASRRLAALSAAVRETGATLVSLRSVDSPPPEGLVASSHELRTNGSHRQIAELLDRVYAMPGMAAVDDLGIEHSEDGAPGELSAALRVTWYAPADPLAAQDQEGAER